MNSKISIIDEQIFKSIALKQYISKLNRLCMVKKIPFINGDSNPLSEQNRLSMLFMNSKVSIVHEQIKKSTHERLSLPLN